MTYRLPEYVEFVRVDDDRAILAGPLEKKELTGTSVDLVSRVVPVLRDGASVGELADAISEPESTIEALLDALSETGMIHTVNIDDERAGDFWEWSSDDSVVVRRTLEDASIGVHAPTAVPRPELDWGSVRDLASLDNLRESADELDFIVTVTTGVRPSYHRAVTEQVHDASLPWLPSRLVGSEIRLGPLTRTGVDACYDCYRQRSLASEQEVEGTRREHAQRETDGALPNYLPSIHAQVTSMMELEAFAFLSGERTPNTAGSVVTYDVFDQTTRHSDVLKLPGCEVCGTS